MYGNLGKYLFSIGETRGAEEALRESAGILLSLKTPNYLYFAVSYARYVAALVARWGRSGFSARLLGACDAADQRFGHVSDQDELICDIAVRAINEQLPPVQAKALLAQGTGEDVFDLLEEYLAQPAASEAHDERYIESLSNLGDTRVTQLAEQRGREGRTRCVNRRPPSRNDDAQWGV